MRVIRRSPAAATAAFERNVVVKPPFWLFWHITVFADPVIVSRALVAPRPTALGTGVRPKPVRPSPHEENPKCTVSFGFGGQKG